MNNIEKQVCAVCGQEKPLGDFYRKRDTVERQCKVCRRASMALLNADPARRERRRAVSKAWDAANPDRKRENNKRRWQEAPDLMRRRSREAQARYKAKNPDRGKKYWEQWKQADINAVRAFWRAAWHTRQARKKGVGGRHNCSDIEAKRRQQGGLCWWCGKPLDSYHVDHWIALSKGGSNGPENLVIACPECNLKKWNKMPWEFNGRLL